MYQMEQKNADIMNVKNVGIDSSHYETMEKIPCPDCEAEMTTRLDQMKVLEDILDTAQLLQKIEG